MGTKNIGRVALDSSDKAIVAGFQWAKEQALRYVYHNDPVGDWYEAALPGREAFCMRDVAHQSTGAHILGLQSHTRNMLRRFAENSAASRDWCSYWEITRDNLPAPVDYADDQDFWYNLPANFDVLDCCYRQYQWTKDSSYIDDLAFLSFYDHTVSDYVKTWDRNGDGMLEHLPYDGRRGIASYHEQDINTTLIAGDLIAAQYAGYQAYASIQALRNSRDSAALFTEKARLLKEHYNSLWWNEAAGRYYSAQLQDGSFASSYRGIANFLALYFSLTDAERKTASALNDILINSCPGVEDRSYLPEILYRYGNHREAYAALLALVDPTLPRREYPEVSYSVIGVIASMMMGISPDAVTGTITTRAHLTAETAWIQMEHIPVFEQEISVYHRGMKETTLVNASYAPLSWKACFAGEGEYAYVDGMIRQITCRSGMDGQPEICVTVEVAPSQSCTVCLCQS